MSAFADSSALVKLYADETDRDAVRALHPLVISCLARVEVPAAFWRKHRDGELDAHHAHVLTAEFEADYYGEDTNKARFVVIGVPAAILDDAARLVAMHGIRAYDAVQLAGAIAAREADPDCATFACFDRLLRRAASAEGFHLLP